MVWFLDPEIAKMVQNVSGSRNHRSCQQITWKERLREIGEYDENSQDWHEKDVLRASTLFFPCLSTENNLPWTN